MALSEEVKQILNRIEKRQQTAEDITVLRQWVLVGDRQVVQQLGKYHVNIGEGREIYIGDRIYQQWDEDAIQALVKAIQNVTWQCVASLMEKDFTSVEVDSTGIGIIDGFSQIMTNFSQQNVMLYGLKLAWSPTPHNDYFISGGNQVIKRWQKQKNAWEITQKIEDSGGISDLWFTSVAVSPDGQLIAACKNYQIKIWRLGEETALHTFGKTLLSNFFDVAGFDSIVFSPDGKILAVTDNKDIRLYDIESGKEVIKLSEHSDKVTCVAFNPRNGRILASCSYDKTIKLWDLDKRKCLGTLSAHQDNIYIITFSSDGEILASGSKDNHIKLWNLKAVEMPETLRKHSDAVTCLVFSPDGKTLVSGSNDGTIVEWKILEKESQTFPEKHRRGVTSIAMSPDGKTLISGGRDQTIKVWKR